jgi:hypothetical protein
VIDSAGDEHVASLRRTHDTRTATTTATPPPTATTTATPSPTATTTATPPPASTPTAPTSPDGVTIPVIGVTVPVPGALRASVTLPVPVVGPFDLPVAPAVLLALVGAGVAIRRL